MQRFNLICDALVKDTGVDPRIMYCQSTGMPVGRLSDDTLRDLFASCTPADDDMTGDELLTRTLASARPSPAWNKFERATLDRLRHSNPTLLLSYLLNRLATPLKRHNDNQFSPTITMDVVHNRIRLYSWCARLQVTEKTLNHLLMVLLDLDVRWSLLRLSSPTNVLALIDKGDEGSVLKACEDLNEWFLKLQSAEMDAQKKQRESDRSFTNGNKLARVAFMHEWIRQKPVGERKAAEIQKEAAKQENLSWLEDLEKELMNQSMSAAGRVIPLKPVLKPSKPAHEVARHGIVQTTKVPMRFGVKAS